MGSRGDRLVSLTAHGAPGVRTITLPRAGQVQLGAWDHKQGFLGGGEENQKLVRVFGKPDGAGFRVVLYPRKPDEPRPWPSAGRTDEHR